jgi:hypothetical protein
MVEFSLPSTCRSQTSGSLYSSLLYTHTHTHTHVYIHTHTYNLVQGSGLCECPCGISSIPWNSLSKASKAFQVIQPGQPTLSGIMYLTLKLTDSDSGL